MEASGIPFKISQQDKKKLWDSWKEDVGGYKRARKLETSFRGCKIQVWGLNRSKYLEYFMKPKASSLGIVFV